MVSDGRIQRPRDRAVVPAGDMAAGSVPGAALLALLLT
jgi:hypothetical protein